MLVIMNWMKRPLHNCGDGSKGMYLRKQICLFFAEKDKIQAKKTFSAVFFCFYPVIGRIFPVPGYSRWILRDALSKFNTIHLIVNWAVTFSRPK